MTGSVTFTAHLGDPDNAPIGEVEIGGEGAIALVLVMDQAYRQALENIVAHVNGLPALRIKAPVPGGEPGAITRAEVRRDDPGLVRAIVAFMEEKYDLYLQPIPV